MTDWTLFPFSFPRWTVDKPEPETDDSAPFMETERRKIIGDLVAVGACDSEYGIHMLMSVYPDQF